MASLVGGVFDEFSTLNHKEIQKAVGVIGANVSFCNVVGPDCGPLKGTPGNDIFIVNDSHTKISDKGGTDIVISSVSYTLPGGVEHLILTGSDDINGTGSSKGNVIAGNDGNNVLTGGSGNDLLLGGAGNDTLVGGSGSDTLCGGEGNDLIKGSSGADTLDGGNGNDTIFASSGNDLVNAGDGDDKVEGDSGNDTIYGGDGNDLIIGGSGNDSLVGGDGNDTMVGDSGKDTLYGGAGNDILTGGSGGDMFYFGEGAGTTTITDFNWANDKIVVEHDVNGSGITTADDILTTLTHDAMGDAVFSLGAKTVTLVGVDEDDVNAGFFKIV